MTACGMGRASVHVVRDRQSAATLQGLTNAKGVLLLIGFPSAPSAYYQMEGCRPVQEAT